MCLCLTTLKKLKFIDSATKVLDATFFSISCRNFTFILHVVLVLCVRALSTPHELIKLISTLRKHDRIDDCIYVAVTWKPKTKQKNLEMMKN